MPNGATNYDYNYYLGDNLGNTRVTFGTKTGAAVTYQQDDYYPFGMEILRTSPVPNPKNEYLYNRKELQEDFTEYDYEARYYDPIIGRWNTVDPLAEISRRWSPYNYTENNPIRNTDVDGMWTDISGGITTTDPDEIAAFVKLQKGQNDGGDKNKKKGTEDKKKKEVAKPKPQDNTQLTKKQWDQVISLERMVGDHLVMLATAGLMSGEDESESTEVTDKTEVETTVLGKFPAYLELAQKIGANVFNIQKDLWNTLTKEEQWNLNVKFLDDAVARGDKIVLEHPVFSINEETGIFRRELDYLHSVKGYRLNNEGTQMIK